MSGKKSDTKGIYRGILYFAGSLLLFAIYYLIYTQLFGFKTPRTLHLEQKLERVASRVEVVEYKKQEIKSTLASLKERDINVYRTIFGMKSDSAFVGNWNIKESFLSSELSQLYNALYVQSLSYDTIAPLAKDINNMGSCVPSIPPVNPTRIIISSPFGVRLDPMGGDAKVHSGVDLAGPAGEPIYVTGDGRVESVNFSFFGYGNEVIVNHGFGYKTRYAHMQRSLVHENQFLKRGDQIGLMGSSGKSTGNHLHYEVLYMGNRVNPINFFNKNISESEFERLVRGTK